MSLWDVRPWFDEGDDWPEESGSWSRIEAESKEAAIAAFNEAEFFTSVSWVEAAPAADRRVIRTWLPLLTYLAADDPPEMAYNHRGSAADSGPGEG